MKLYGENERKRKTKLLSPDVKENVFLSASCKRRYG